MKQFYFKKFHDKDLMKEVLMKKVLMKKVMKIDLAEKVQKRRILMEDFSNEKGMKEAVFVKSSFLINKISEKIMRGKQWQEQSNEKVTLKIL